MKNILKKCTLTMIIQENLLTLAAVDHVTRLFSPKTIKLLDTRRVEIESDTIVRAEIIDFELVRGIIAEFAEQYKPSAAIVIAHSPEAIVKFLPIFKMKRSDLRKYIASEIHYAFPVKTEDYVFDCNINDLQAFAVALPKRISNGYAELFSSLDINLTAIELYDNCVCGYTGAIDMECHLTAFKSCGDYIFMLVNKGNACDICRIHNVQDDFMGIGRLSIFLSRHSIKKVYFIDFISTELTDFFTDNSIDIIHLSGITTSPEFYRTVFHTRKQRKYSR